MGTDKMENLNIVVRGCQLNSVIMAGLGWVSGPGAQYIPTVSYWHYECVEERGKCLFMSTSI